MSALVVSVFMGANAVSRMLLCDLVLEMVSIWVSYFKYHVSYALQLR
jgi:hypothetical protein